MRPRFVGRLGLADVVTTTNAALGFCAAAAVTLGPGGPLLAARLVLLAAIADALDGLVARWRGSTPVGEYLDSLADVASFGVAPALVVFALVRAGPGGESPSLEVAALVVSALFVAMAVVRLAFYTAHDVENEHTEGVQSTLAATVVAAAVLVGVDARLLLAVTAVLVYLMVATVTYPDLRTRDMLVMGGVQALAVLAPRAFGGLFPAALLAWAVAYLVLAPWFYWR